MHEGGGTVGLDLLKPVKMKIFQSSKVQKVLTLYLVVTKRAHILTCSKLTIEILEPGVKYVQS